MIALITRLPTSTYVMILPILILWLITLAIIVERIIYYRKRRVAKNFFNDLGRFLDTGDYREAEKFCNKKNNPASFSISGVLEVVSRNKNRNGSKSALRLSATETYKLIGNDQISLLERHLTVLSTIATIAPLFGLLGTVTGMLRSFNFLSSTAVSEMSAKYAQGIASGITEALVTTFLGLVVAIPAYIFYNYFISKISIFALEMERGLYLLIESFFSSR